MRTDPTSPQLPSSGVTTASLLSTAASVAATAGRRAAAVTASAQSSSKLRSPGNDGPRKEVRCVEGYEKNLYIGRSDGEIEWWVLDGTSTSATVGQLGLGDHASDTLSAQWLDIKA